MKKDYESSRLFWLGKNRLKKILLSISITLLAFTSSAQFPTPYCEVGFSSGVEPITLVQFAGIDNASSAATGGDEHQDFTAITGNVVAGSSYSIKVKGNTAGNFTSQIVVYFDWNQNNDLTDAGEKYTLPSITNSTGTDATESVFNIQIPASALAGSTRMRVMKRFSTVPDPCNTAGFGQAEDYTVVVTIPTCPSTSGLTATTTATSADLSWTENGTATDWDIEYGPAGFASTGVPTLSATSNPETLTGLTSSTSYDFYVRAVCSPTDQSVWTGPFTFTTTQIPAVLPYTDDFSSDEWTAVNGTQNNKWFVGSAAGNPANGLYISNDNGVTNEYTTGGTSVTHAYRDIAFPAGGGTFNLSFDWKANGEGFTASKFDYFRVWIVPTSATITAGTQITATNTPGAHQVGGDFNNKTAWVVNENFIIPASFSGTTSRLVFEWRNDSSGGNQSPAAIDNVNVSEITCASPSALTANSTESSSDLSWTENGTATEWDIEYGPVGFTATGLPTTTVSSNPTTISGLNPTTAYDYYVRSVCNLTDQSVWVGPFTFTTTQIPAVLPYTDDFSSNEWTAVNGTQNNKWFVGSAAGNPADGLYISNDNGVTNAYTTSGTSVTHAYRDIAFPTGGSTFNFSFDWKANGEGFTTSKYDYFRVWIVPTSATITAGTQITATNTPGAHQVGGDFNNKTAWVVNESFVLPASFSGTTSRLVFEWRNDSGSGNQSPAAIDNVNISEILCSAPTALTAIATETSADLSWTENGTSTDWDIEYGPVGFTTTGTPTTSVSSNPTTISGLSASTTYDYYVRSVCSPTSESAWVGPFTFTTTQIPAVLPYTDDFSSNEWMAVNGTQNNKWFVGSAAGNPANGLYISNDNGVTNAYTTSGTSVTHAYRDIDFPAGGNTFNLSFDWKANGEGFGSFPYDYFTVWVVPTTATITAGTQISISNTPDAVQLGGIFNNKTTWVIGENFVIPASFSGTTSRLVFEWRNDVSGGSQSPAAIDNVNVFEISCAAPTALTADNITTSTFDFGWTEEGTSSDWEIKYGLAGFAPNAGTVIFATSNPISITGLQASTNYDFYVRSICSPTDSSTWSGPLSVSTLCGPISVLPWTENFDNMTSVGYDVFPLCWVAETTFEWNTSNSPTSGFNAGPLSGSNYLKVDYWSDSKIWTPEFELVAGETYEFSFSWAGDGEASWEGSVFVNDSQTSSGATMLGTSFIEIGDANPMTYRNEVYCFSPTVSGVYSFGIYAYDDDFNYSSDALSFDDFALKQVVSVPGVNGTLSVCQTGSLVDLNDVITTTVTDGTWNFNLNPNAVNTAGMFNAASVPAGIHDFLYITGGCAPDTTVATITVVKPSSAGNDGSLAVCRNQPFNLLPGLGGSIDMGGVWLDPNAVVLPNGNTTSSNIPGQYNYKYIVSNGVCPSDTAKVVVNVQGCDYLGVEDVALEGFNMYPNPTSNLVFITNTGSTEVFNYEVLDMNGRIILKANQAIDGSTTTELDLSKVEIGVYLIRVFNEHADKTFRLVKN